MSDVLSKEDLLAFLTRSQGIPPKPSGALSPAKPGVMPCSGSTSPTGRAKRGVVCVFCRNNGESEMIYLSHNLKDSTGRVTCPVLRAYTCPNCGANGDNSHTIKYCPMSTGETINIRSLKTARSATGKRRSPLPPLP